MKPVSIEREVLADALREVGGESAWQATSATDQAAWVKALALSTPEWRSADALELANAIATGQNAPFGHRLARIRRQRLWRTYLDNASGWSSGLSATEWDICGQAA